MRLGLIARADSRGLGVQTRAYHDNLHPIKTMVVDCSSMKPLPIRQDWYPYAHWVHGLPCRKDWERFLLGVDCLLSAETYYGYDVYSIAREMGVKTVLAANFEFLDRRDQPSLWAAPSRWRWNEWPEPKIHLPVPVETGRFTPTTARRASHFLHVIGRPAIHDRAGTVDMLMALQNVFTELTVTITCQEPGYVQGLMRTHGIKLPDNIDLIVSEGDRTNYWSLYDGQHVLISPRRFGGLSLPMQEACAAGLPVISTAVSPQKDWLPHDWLVTASNAGEFHAKQRIDLYSADHLALAEKISRFATNPVFYRQASEQAVTIAKGLSWENLRPEYERVLA
jgi:glycosyltransferase involved in cell wall biosynthesis